MQLEKVPSLVRRVTESTARPKSVLAGLRVQLSLDDALLPRGSLHQRGGESLKHGRCCWADERICEASGVGGQERCQCPMGQLSATTQSEASLGQVYG